MKLIDNWYWLITGGIIIVGGVLFPKILFIIAKTYPLLPKASPAIKEMCKVLWCVQAILGIIFLSIWIFKPLSARTFSDLVYLGTGVIFVAGAISLLIISARH